KRPGKRSRIESNIRTKQSVVNSTIQVPANPAAGNLNVRRYSKSKVVEANSGRIGYRTHHYFANAGERTEGETHSPRSISINRIGGIEASIPVNIYHSKLVEK